MKLLKIRYLGTLIFMTMLCSTANANLPMWESKLHTNADHQSLLPTSSQSNSKLLGNITVQNAIDTYNNQFSSWITESDFDRYGLLTPGDIMASDISDIRKAMSILTYIVIAKKIDLDGQPQTQDIIHYANGNIASMAIHYNSMIIPLFSITKQFSNQCFMTYPSDHYRIMLPRTVCQYINFPKVSTFSYASQAITNLNYLFSGFVDERDHDRIGLLSPMDILLSDKDDAHIAMDMQRYFITANTMALKTDERMRIYRDGHVITGTLVMPDRQLPLFAIDYHDINKCHIMHTNDSAPGKSISPHLCRLIRAAHPMLDNLKAEYFDPMYWSTRTDSSDNGDVFPNEKITALNKQFIEQARITWAEIIPDSPAPLWSIWNMPNNLTIRDVIDATIQLRKYPFMRESGAPYPRQMTYMDIQSILGLMPFPGGIEKKVDTEKGRDYAVMHIDPEYLDQSFTPQYGWLVQQTDMRAVPSHAAALFYTTDDDHWQYTSLHAEQPVVIIEKTTDHNDKQWYYILSTAVRGWVIADHVALIDKSDIPFKWPQQNVMTVTAPMINIRNRVYGMGTRFEIESEISTGFMVYTSEKSKSGNLVRILEYVSNSDISKNISESNFYNGIVPMSRFNMRKLLFKYLGTPWAMASERRGDSISYDIPNIISYELIGNRLHYIDCSGIMASAMRAMGIDGFARNSWLQSNQGMVLWNKDTQADMSLEQALDNHPNTWFIGMRGHIVFYLGKAKDGTHMVLHSPGHLKHYLPDSDDYIRFGDGMALISPLDLSKLDERYTRISQPN